MQILRAPLGGLFRHVIDLSSYLIEKGHAIGIIADQKASEHHNNILKEISDHCQLGVHRFDIPRAPSWQDYRHIKTIRGLLREHNVMLTHGHGAKGGAYARLASRFTPSHAIYTPHGGSLHYHWKQASGAAFLMMERLLRSPKNGMIFESHYGHNTFQHKIGKPKGIVKVIYNGLRPDEFSLINHNKKRDYQFVFIGEMRHIKGIDTLIDALKILITKGHDHLRCAFVGSGSDLQNFKNYVTEQNLDRHVTFMPAMPARVAFGLGDCLIVPSRAESLPYIVMEACACALPVIATNIGGISEIMRPVKETLIPPDHPQDLAKAMLTMHHHLDEAQTKALRLRDYILENFSIERMGGDIVSLYREVVNQKKS